MKNKPFIFDYISVILFNHTTFDRKRQESESFNHWT